MNNQLVMQQQQFQNSALNTMNQMQQMMQRMQMNQQQQVMNNSMGGQGFMQNQMGGFASGFGINPGGISGGINSLGRTMGNMGNMGMTGLSMGTSTVFAASLAPEQRGALARTMGTNLFDGGLATVGAVGSVAGGVADIGSWFVHPALGIAKTIAMPGLEKYATSSMADIFGSPFGGRVPSGLFHPIDSARAQLQTSKQWQDYLGENSYLFAKQNIGSNNNQPGLSADQNRAYASAIRSFSPKFHMSQEDINSTLPTLIEGGMMRGTQDLEGFTDKFASLVKYIKTSATILGKTKGQIAELMVEWDKAGLMTTNFDLEASKLKMYGAQMGKSVDYMANYKIQNVARNQTGTTQDTNTVGDQGIQDLGLVSRLLDYGKQTGNHSIASQVASAGGDQGAANLFHDVKQNMFGSAAATNWAPAFFNYQNGKFNFDSAGFSAASQGLVDGTVTAAQLAALAAKHTSSWGTPGKLAWESDKSNILMGLDYPTQTSMFKTLIDVSQANMGSNGKGLSMSDMLHTILGTTSAQGNLVQTLMGQYGRTGAMDSVNASVMPLLALGSNLSQAYLADLKGGNYYNVQQKLTDIASKFVVNPADNWSKMFEEKMNKNLGLAPSEIANWNPTRLDYDFSDAGIRRTGMRANLNILSPMGGALGSFSQSYNNYLGKSNMGTASYNDVGGTNVSTIENMIRGASTLTGTNMDGLLADIGTRNSGWFNTAYNKVVHGGEIQVGGQYQAQFNQAMLTDSFKAQGDNYLSRLKLNDLYTSNTYSSSSNIVNSIQSNTSNADNSLSQQYSNQFSGATGDAINAAANKFGINAAVIKAIAIQESNGSHLGANGAVKNGGGALGIMQVSPGSNPGGYNLNNEGQNIMAGAQIMQENMARYGNNVGLSAYAYNSGAGALAQAFRNTTGMNINTLSKEELGNFDASTLAGQIRQIALNTPGLANVADAKAQYGLNIMSNMNHLGGALGGGAYDLSAPSNQIITNTDFSTPGDLVNGSINLASKLLNMPTASKNPEYAEGLIKLQGMLGMKDALGSHVTRTEVATRPTAIDYQGLSQLTGDIMSSADKSGAQGSVGKVVGALNAMSSMSPEQLNNDWITTRINEISQVMNDFNSKVDSTLVDKLKKTKEFLEGYKSKVVTSFSTQYDQEWIKLQQQLLTDMDKAISGDSKFSGDYDAVSALDQFRSSFASLSNVPIGNQTKQNVTSLLTSSAAVKKSVTKTLFGGNAQKAGFYDLDAQFGDDVTGNAAQLMTMSNTQLRALTAVAKQAMPESVDTTKLLGDLKSMMNSSDPAERTAATTDASRILTDFLSNGSTVLKVTFTDEDRRVIAGAREIESTAQLNLTKNIVASRQNVQSVLDMGRPNATVSSVSSGISSYTGYEGEMAAARAAGNDTWYDSAQKSRDSIRRATVFAQQDAVSRTKGEFTDLFKGMDLNGMQSSIMHKRNTLNQKSSWSAADKMEYDSLNQGLTAINAGMAFRSSGDVRVLDGVTASQFRSGFASAGVSNPKVEGRISAALAGNTQNQIYDSEISNIGTDTRGVPKLTTGNKGATPLLTPDKFNDYVDRIQNGSITSDDKDMLLAYSLSGDSASFGYKMLLDRANTKDTFGGIGVFTNSLKKKYAADYSLGRGTSEGSIGATLTVNGETITTLTSEQMLNGAGFADKQRELIDAANKNYGKVVDRFVSALPSESGNLGNPEDLRKIISGLRGGYSLEMIKQSGVDVSAVERSAVGKALLANPEYKAHAEAAPKAKIAIDALNQIQAGIREDDAAKYDLTKIGMQIKDFVTGMLSTSTDKIQDILKSVNVDTSKLGEDWTKLYSESQKKLMSDVEKTVKDHRGDSVEIQNNAVKDNVVDYVHNLTNIKGLTEAAALAITKTQAGDQGKTILNSIAAAEVGLAPDDKKRAELEGYRKQIDDAVTSMTSSTAGIDEIVTGTAKILQVSEQVSKNTGNAVTNASSQMDILNGLLDEYGKGVNKAIATMHTNISGITPTDTPHTSLGGWISNNLSYLKNKL